MAWSPSFVADASTTGISGVTSQDRALGTTVLAVGDVLLGTAVFLGSSTDQVSSMSDTQGNTWSLIRRTALQGGRRGEHWWAIATAASTITVTFTFNQTISPTSVLVGAFTGMDSPVVHVQNEFQETVNTITHNSAPSGGIATSQANVMVCGGVLTASAGTITNPTGFTQFVTLGTAARTFWKINTSSESGQRGQWGITNSRQSSGAIFAWAENISGGGITLAQLEHATGRGAFRGMGRGMR